MTLLIAAGVSGTEKKLSAETFKGRIGAKYPQNGYQTFAIKTPMSSRDLTAL